MCTTTTAAVSGAMRASTSARSNAIVSRIAVDEHDARAGVHRGGGGREERVGGDDDLAALDAERAQDDLERARAGADRDRVLRCRGASANASSSSRPIGPSVSWPRREGFVDPGEDLGAVFGRETDPRRGHAHERTIYRR